MSEPYDVAIRDQSIRLGQFLKLANLVDTGSEAKPVIQEKCVACHDLRRVVNANKDAEEWRETVHMMKAAGARTETARTRRRTAPRSSRLRIAPARETRGAELGAPPRGSMESRKA